MAEFDERAAIDRFWEARRKGDFFPAEWRDRLDFEQAYRVQLGVAAWGALSGTATIAGPSTSPSTRY